MIVMKFGGTSVGDAARIDELGRIVERSLKEDKQIIVVVSAMSGVTNSLIASARAAAQGQESVYTSARSSLIYKHHEVVQKLIKNEKRKSQVLAEVDALLENFGKLCYGISILGEISERSLDAISSLGERLSARIVAASLQERGLQSVHIDATDLIITDDNFGDATPDLEETTRRVEQRLLPLLADGVIPVVTGFIGATGSGITTTLGRGGSDYSAGILGACLNADEVWIWTDVDGVMTADPGLVPCARTLPEITYSEAAELSYYGAKVLHPKTLLPLVHKEIPLIIKNSFNPDAGGTRISEKGGYWSAPIKAITSIKGVTLVTISGRGMMGVPGIAAKTFTAVASKNVNVLMISQSSSENNICFIVNTGDVEETYNALRRALEVEFHHKHVEDISLHSNVAIVAVVGDRMKGTPGIAARIFSSVGREGVNVIAIAQGSSEINISFVIEEKDVAAAVSAIHKEFDLGNQSSDGRPT